MKGKKSFKARVVSAILRLTSKRKYSVRPDKALAQFAKQKAAGEQRFAMPDLRKFRSRVTQSAFGNTDVYTFERADAPHGENAVGTTVFYFHGGGYVHRPRSFHFKFADKLVQSAGVRVIFPLYPLAPFYNYTHMYNAIVPMYSRIADSCNGKIVFMGDSAGGGFALSLYQYLIEHGMRRPDAVVALSPWVDLATDNPDMVPIQKSDAMLVISTTQVWGKLWADGDDMHSYFVSPLYYNNFAALSNVHLFVGTDEIMYPDVVKFYDRIAGNDGCTLTVGARMNHVYPLYPIPEANLALRQICEIISNL